MFYKRSCAFGMTLIVMLTTCPTIAVGQAVRENYSYDVLGRLKTKCQATNSVAQHVKYWFDRAGNRTNYVSGSPILTLHNDQSVVSSNGKFILIMQGDGNLVVYGNSGSGLVFLGWASNTSGSGSNRVQMQADGNLVTYTAADIPTWSSNTSGNDCAALYVQDDGNVVIKNRADEVIWQTGTGGH